MTDTLFNQYPGSLDLPPGRYQIEGGLYNLRTRIRYAFDMPADEVEANRRKRFFRWGEIVVE